MEGEVSLKYHETARSIIKSGNAKHFCANSWFTIAEKTTNWFKKSAFLDNPIANCTLGTVIIHTHFVQSLAIG